MSPQPCMMCYANSTHHTHTFSIFPHSDGLICHGRYDGSVSLLRFKVLAGGKKEGRQGIEIRKDVKKTTKPLIR